MGRVTATLVVATVIWCSAVAAQNRIAIIDFYGLRSVSEATARAALGISVGDSLSPALDHATGRLTTLPGILGASLEAVCCAEGGFIVYAGVSEAGAPVPQFDPAPTDTVSLPTDILQDARALGDTLMSAIRQGQAGEDDSQGHALLEYPAARAIQERFLIYASRDQARLRAVLHQSADPEARAIAAEVLAYADPKAPILSDLVQAMRDPDPSVRNNAGRALAILGRWASGHPEAKIEVPLTPFVALLNSLVWTDRNKSSMAVMALTADRDSAALTHLRRDALPALVEMARWSNPGHALAPFLVVGRIVGVDDGEAMAAFQRGERESILERALGS